MAERVNLHKKEAAMEVLRRSKIEFALFDADDTKFQTHEIFLTQMGIFKEEVTRSLSPDKAQQFSEHFHELNKAALKIEGISVSEEKWDWIIGLMKRISPELTGAMDQNKHFLEEIYQITPSKVDGIEEVLKTLESGGLELGVLTHASSTWNQQKLQGTGLSIYFHPNNIHTVPLYGFKQKEHWLKAIKQSGFEPEQTIVFGNSLTSDIIPASEVGVQMNVWLRDEAASAFFAQGSEPEGTIIINHYNQLFDAILEAC